jgi:hypothetical protein
MAMIKPKMMKISKSSIYSHKYDYILTAVTAFVMCCSTCPEFGHW